MRKLRSVCMIALLAMNQCALNMDTGAKDELPLIELCPEMVQHMLSA